MAAYLWWGLMPLYFVRLRLIPAGEILAFRLASSLFVMGGFLLALRRWPQFVAALRTGRIRHALFASSVLVGLNWLLYTYSIVIGKTVEASLGYFLQPLLNAVVGVWLFHERFRIGQVVALAIATLGVVLLIVYSGTPPWIALGLALSFGSYSVVRKLTPVDGVVGLSVEVVLLFPLALAYLVWLQRSGRMSLGLYDSGTDIWLLIGGLMTAIPMICFGQAARRLKISTLGFMQYISPLMQFVLALTIMGEALERSQILGYAVVGIALLVFIVDSILAQRRRPDSAKESSEEMSGPSTAASSPG